MQGFIDHKIALTRVARNYELADRTRADYAREGNLTARDQHRYGMDLICATWAECRNITWKEAEREIIGRINEAQQNAAAFAAFQL